eukprot:339937-Prymnesium_polylepis.1
MRRTPNLAKCSGGPNVAAELRGDVVLLWSTLLRAPRPSASPAALERAHFGLSTAVRAVTSTGAGRPGGWPR